MTDPTTSRSDPADPAAPESITALFRRVALDLGEPDATAVVDGDARLSRRELDRRVDAIAAHLTALGAGPGAPVAFHLPNWWETIALFRACWQIRALAAPIHHLAGPTDIALILDEVRPAVVLAAPDLGAIEHPGALAVRGAGDAIAPMLTADLPVVEGREGEPVHEASPDDLAVVLFTSGSSGRPKGVLHTHGALAYKARTLVRVHGLDHHDVVLMPSPMAHISGLSNAVMIPGAGGLTSVLMAKWDPSSAVDLVERERVTFMMGPPTFFRTMAATPTFTPARVASMRLISCGGAGVTPEFAREAAATFGATVKRTYGSTEAPAVTSWHVGDDPGRAHDSDGRATGAVEIHIVDPDTGERRPTGEPGEIWLRGPEVFVGYLDPSRNAAAMRDGWFRTGDLGTLDAGGWLRVVGRIKDVIIRGGENISAVELETVLLAHPAVRDAAVVGYPDERLGERVCAFVVADEPVDLATSRRWFEASGVTRFKWPEHVVQLDELPQLVSGKVDRAELRRRAEHPEAGNARPAT